MGLNADNLATLTCSATEQQILIRLARKAIDEAIEGRGISPPPEALPNQLLQPAASFVTLSLVGRLRGCVGNLVAREPVYRSVMNNAVGAALRDTRFDPVTLEEAALLSVHISILSALVPLRFNSIEGPLDQLTPGRDGVVLRRSGRTSTYLPQVWETIREKRTFLESLCRKAGLDSDAWTHPETEILTYRVFEFGDDEPR